MAKLNMEEVIDHLEDKMRKALQATIREHFPDQEFNSRAVYKTFKNEVYKKCNAWESVPNKYIRSD